MEALLVQLLKIDRYGFDFYILMWIDLNIYQWSYSNFVTRKKYNSEKILCEKKYE